jgi:cob(I)alamin adenosyltransferase
MRITKVYTRTGDSGQTRLAGGQQVWKDSLRVEAYGTVDELNASLGVVQVSIAEGIWTTEQTKHLGEHIFWIQHKLFDAGALLATAPGQTFAQMPVIQEGDITRLEHLIDECQKELRPLKEFILPGGGKISSLLHQARTICRRAERVCVRLARDEQVDPLIVKFLNRLGDALFVLARWAAKSQGEAEVLWKREIAQSEPAR